MSESTRQRGPRERWASEHERARQRAAERLSLPLPAAENGWLNRHLATCSACDTVAADYAAQQAALRTLQEPVPPRDLWARTAAALDRAERTAVRDLPNPSVFPGRGGIPGSRGARSIRGLRAEQRASAFRSAPRQAPPRVLVDHRVPPVGRTPGLAWIAPFGALAALAIVIVVGGNALLTSSPVAPLRSPLAASASLAAAGNATPFATPIQVGAGEVAWLTPADDGTYSLNLASVDQVCPTNAKADCAPISAAAPRHLPGIGSALHTVIRSPSRNQLVVVPTSTKKGSGGRVMVVAVPTPVAPAGGSASPAVTVSDAAPSSTASAPPTPSALPSGNGVVGGGSPSAPLTSPDGSTPGSQPAGGSPDASPGETGTPTDVASPVVGNGSPAPTATDGQAPGGSSAGPGGSTSPVPAATVQPTAPEPTAAALAIISDVVVVGETASYSPDGTMLAFSARPADGSHGPDIYLWRVGDTAAQALTTDHASVFSGWLNNVLLGSRAVDAAGRPLGLGPTSSPTGSVAGATSSPTVGGPSASPSTGPDTTGTMPSADPTQFSAPTDADASPEPSPSDPPSASEGPVRDGSPADSTPTDDSANVAPLSEGAAVLTDADPNAARLAPVQLVIAADLPANALARSFVLDPVSRVETALAAPAWRPVVDPTGRFVAYWAGSLRYDQPSMSWIPDRGALVLASWPALRGSDPGVALAPVPMLDNGATAPAGEWDIRWDETGTHIAIWAADAGNPDLGRLTLLSIDAAGHVDPTGVALHDAPALAGFSIGADRLAWATPPGQDGEGSHLQVLAWSGENAGNIDSQPVSGGDAVVVVR